MTSKYNLWYEQNNSSARASRFLVHFFDIHCTSTTWHFLMRRFMGDVNTKRGVFLSLFELDYKQTPGKFSSKFSVTNKSRKLNKLDKVSYNANSFFIDSFLTCHHRRGCLTLWTLGLQYEVQVLPWPLAGFVHGSPKFKSSTMLVNSQLVCPRPVGILKAV